MQLKYFHYFLLVNQVFERIILDNLGKLINSRNYTRFLNFIRKQVKIYLRFDITFIRQQLERHTLLLTSI